MELSSYLPKKRLENVILLKVTDSTNTRLKNMLNAPCGTVVVAEEQTGGRGRYGRHFYSPRGGIYLSYLYGGKYDDAAFLTAVCGVAVKRAAEKICGVKLSLKWVNDLLLNGKKVCGILTEAVYFGAEHRTVIGIGINCGSENEPLADEIAAVATSIYAETGAVPNKNALCAEIITALDSLDCCDSSEIFNEYKENCITLGKKVRAITQNGEQEGEIIGINPDFSLEFLQKSGKITKIFNGEVTFKPL